MIDLVYKYRCDKCGEEDEYKILDQLPFGDVRVVMLPNGWFLVQGAKGSSAGSGIYCSRHRIEVKDGMEVIV